MTNLKLSEKEVEVFEYIKRVAAEHNGMIQESMKTIGESLGGISEATVHRCVQKLRRAGIVGIASSTEKAASNYYVYYGEQTEDENIEDIKGYLIQLGSSLDRYESILASKDHQISKLKRERESHFDELEKMEKELSDAKITIKTLQKRIESRGLDQAIFGDSEIITITEIGEDGTKALLFRDK